MPATGFFPAAQTDGKATVHSKQPMQSVRILMALFSER